MLEFPSQDSIDVYAGLTGFICFKSKGHLAHDPEEKIICLTIGQFRAVVKNADKLIAEAEAKKALGKVANND